MQLINKHGEVVSIVSEFELKDAQVADKMLLVRMFSEELSD